MCAPPVVAPQLAINGNDYYYLGLRSQAIACHRSAVRLCSRARKRGSSRRFVLQIKRER